MHDLLRERLTADQSPFDCFRLARDHLQTEEFFIKTAFGSFLD
jgi:hypothetical protein